MEEKIGKIESVEFGEGGYQDARCSSLDELSGKPVAVCFDGMTMKSWRILAEAL